MNPASAASLWSSPTGRAGPLSQPPSRALSRSSSRTGSPTGDRRTSLGPDDSGPSQAESDAFLHRAPIVFDATVNAHMKNPIAIPGLHYIPNAITEEQEQQIFRIVDSRPYSTTIHRRQQFYGERYYHTTHDLTALQPMTEQQAKLQSYPLEDMQWLLDHLLPKVAMVTSVVNDTQPPTQILVNEYRENMGIASHFEDALAFGSYILTLSLRNPIWMTMKLPREHTNHCSDILQQTRVLLEPRSLLVMSGESRFDWRHGISKTKTVEGPGGMPAVKRDCGYRRISLTIRYLLDGRKRTLSDRNVPWAPRP